MNLDKELKQLAKQERAIARRAHKLAALQAEQEQERSASDAAKEALALKMLRERDVFNRPADQLVALLSNFDVPAAAVHGAIIPSVPPVQTETGDAQASAKSWSADVSVRISRNASQEKRDLLNRAGLRWNGKAGQWIGTVGRNHVPELQAVFGERVAVSQTIEENAIMAVLPAPAATEAVDPSETASEPRQAVSDADPDISRGEGGDAVQDGSPVAPEGQPGSTVTPVRPRIPARLPRFGSH